MAIDILLKLVGVDGGAIGMFESARQAVSGLTEGTNEAEQSANNLNSTLENARNWGAGMAVGGAAALALASNLAEVYREGARADEKLSAMMAKRGEGGRIEEMADWAGELAYNAALIDDDPIKEAAAGLFGFGLNAQQVQQIMPGLIGQSRLYGQSIDSVAQAFGRAYASGNAGALKRSGVTLSQADLDYIEAATSEIDKQNRMFEKVNQSMERYALSMTEGLSESEIAANRVTLEMDNLQTAVGEGASVAKTSVDNIIVSLLQFVNANEGAAYSTGWLLSVGGYAASAGGSMLALAAQIGMVATGFQAMGVSGVASFTAITAAALPLLIVLGKILLVALLAAAAIYALDKALHWKEDRELAANIAKGEEVSRPLYDAYVKSETKKGKPVKSFEKWQEDPNADDTSNSGGGAADIVNIQRQYDALNVAPSGAMPGSTVTPSIAAYVPDQSKAATAAQKAADKAASAQAKANEKLQDRTAQRQADIEIAQMEEAYANRIAKLEASKPRKGDSSAIDREIAKVRAEQMVKEAELRGKYDDAYAEGSGLEVARIKARGMETRSGFTRASASSGGSSGNAAIDGINAARGGLSMSRAGGTSGGGSFNVNLADHVRVGMDAGGNYVLNFVGQVLLPQPRIVSNVNGLRS